MEMLGRQKLFAMPGAVVCVTGQGDVMTRAGEPRKLGYKCLLRFLGKDSSTVQCVAQTNPRDGRDSLVVLCCCCGRGMVGCACPLNWNACLRRSDERWESQLHLVVMTLCANTNEREESSKV